MAKPRQKQISATSGKKKWDRDSQDDEVDWVVVKKQKVAIIIPPLPAKVLCTMPNIGECGRISENPSKSKSHLPQEITTSSLSKSDSAVSKQSLEERTKNPTLLSTEQGICSREISDPSEPNLISQKKPSVSHHCRTSYRDRNFRDTMGIGTQGNPGDSLKGKMILVDASAFLGRRKRAAYLDKKLKKAGGLEDWLASLGLMCFVKIFRRRNISNKVQLVNLNMKKLKDMGVDAVGPRRKLMHAIDCFCQFRCFQHP